MPASRSDRARRAADVPQTPATGAGLPARPTAVGALSLLAGPPGTRAGRLRRRGLASPPALVAGGGGGSERRLLPRRPVRWDDGMALGPRARSPRGRAPAGGGRSLSDPVSRDLRVLVVDDERNIRK